MTSFISVTSPRAGGSYHELPKLPSNLSSYQANSPDQALGPGMAKILASQERQRAASDPEPGEEMKRRTRFAYLVLGIALLCVYYYLLRRHVFSRFSHHTKANGGGDMKVLHVESYDMLGSSGFNEKFTGEQPHCNDGEYSARTLQLAYELPFPGIFRDTKGQKKYEASDIILVNRTAYAVCDNSWAISKFGDDLTPFSSKNKQIGDPIRGDEGSGFESLFYDDGIFYVLRESIYHQAENDYHSIIEEVIIGEDDYQVLRSCPSEFVFEGDSKGYEGAISIRDTSNELVMLGLCEGNHCSESRKSDRGHGVFVAMKKTISEDGSSCQWDTIRRIKIPKSAYFADYSSATIDERGRVAVASQEDSAVWVGQLLGRDEETGLWDLDELHFDEDVGKIFFFPKDNECETVYCNIEGIHWINHEMIIAVSDKMKSHGRQDFRCFDKDQSVHVFVFP